jgi:hypothetical protein
MDKEVWRKYKMRYKYFLKNLSIFTVSNFITKLLLFFMLPLYTSVLTSEEYGTIDMITTTVNLAMPILTLCITEAIIRFTIDENTNKKQILSNAFDITIKGYIILLVISIIAWIFGFELKILVIFNVYYIVYTIATLLTYYLKGLERIKVIGWASVVRVIVLVLLNCLLLLHFRLSILGYYTSLIISEGIVITIYIYNLKKHKVICNENVDPKLQKEMIGYSKNFILNSISWWINNASDKYILLLFYDLNITGIYSVAYKIPTIIELYEKLRNLRANICFNTVVHKENVCQSKEFAKQLINKLEFQKWQFFQYSSSGKYAYKNKNLFEITDKDFYLFAKNILDATKKSNIEFKDNKQRNGKYLLIDNSGYAWVQFFENEKENRNIIGNIKNLKDWGKIINTIIESENLNETHRYKKHINR